MSEIFYKSRPAMCEDGKVRRVRVKSYRYDGSMAADTFFSVPAHFTYRRKYVRGYVTCEDGELLFYAHNVCQPADWPDRPAS